MPYSDPKRRKAYQTLYRSIHTERAREAGIAWREAHPGYRQTRALTHGQERGIRKPKSILIDPWREAQSGTRKPNPIVVDPFKGDCFK